MKAFEIQTFRGGRWKIDSVFDDRELALFEAQRMDWSRRYSGVRVIEEIFDEITNETKSRTIFSGAKKDLAGRAREAKTKTKGKGKAGVEERGGAGGAPQARRVRKSEKNKKKGMGFMLMVLVVAVIGGLAAIVGLRMLASVL